MTEDPKQYRKLVEALASHEYQEAQELAASLPAHQAEKYSEYMAALFAVLLEDRFRGGISRDGIASFVDQMRREYRTAEPKFKPLTAEGVIRGSAGEVHLLDEIPGEEITSVQTLVIGKLALSGTTVRPDLQNFLSAADELVEGRIDEQ
ncbi:hypothetical protein [Salininema proteolyticum]|uniref:Uncharacterized protein n=1 Tax=Salininema proteolyticum TaxID=1607685 RepID=A0ABV8TZZ4_9ACTN